MRNTPTKPSPVLPTLFKGQIWQCDARLIRIMHVGRHLVEHRAVNRLRKQPITPVSISAIREVQQFLAANKAVLVEVQGPGPLPNRPGKPGLNKAG
jgi:hypothetical protein